MQLEKSLFSLHRAIIANIPVYVLIALVLVVTGFISVEIYHVANQPVAYDLSDCFYDYYKQTRLVSN
jgi:hypothetical protein